MHALRCFLDVLYVAADCAADVAIRASTKRIGFREKKAPGTYFPCHSEGDTERQKDPLGRRCLIYTGSQRNIKYPRGRRCLINKWNQRNNIGRTCLLYKGFTEAELPNGNAPGWRPQEDPGGPRKRQEANIAA